LYNKGKTILIQYPAGKADISFSIPDGVTDIEDSAFYGCTRLESIIIPDSITGIGDGAYEGCISLKNITIPDSVTSIRSHAFSECSALTSVTIGNGVTNIVESAFPDCECLTAINVADGNTAYISQEGVLYNKDKTILIKYPKGKLDVSFTIPDNVNNIGTNAFRDCTCLESIIISKSLISIGEAAFWGCSSLASVIIPNGVTSMEACVFTDCTSLVRVTFQSKIPSSGFSKYAFNCLGDLHDKFYETDPDNGTPGTYTRPSGGSVWTKK
jgi:hypothetical protein